jgi:hypothetical protein
MLLGAGAAALLAAGSAAPALALETVSPRSVQEPAGDVCPALTAIKYPWLSCRGNDYGGVTLMLPDQPAPPACNWRLPSGVCAASEEEWGIVPGVRYPGD